MILNRVVLFIQFIKIVSMIFLSAFILFSCSPERRLTHLLKHNPHLLKKDSILVLDTILVPEKVLSQKIADSALFKATKEHPIVKDSNGVVTTIYHEYNHTYIESKCKQDTLVHNHYNVNNHYTTVEARKHNWKVYALWFCGGIVFILFLKFLIK